jgi:putative tryptophan/tyrosine transport system substrate-binding protein
VRRRDFLAFVSGVTVAWPFLGHAQISTSPVIGLLASRSPEDSANVLVAFREALAHAGYAEGQGVVIEYRWARGGYDRLPALAAELIERKVAAIAAFGPPAALAAKAATSNIPVVFVTGGDPVALGLIGSLSQPGGNVTGVNLLVSEVGSKRLAALTELVPSSHTIAMLINPDNPDAEIETGDALAAMRALGRQGFIIRATSESEIETAFAAIMQKHASALFVGADSFFNSRRDRIVSLAARSRIPAIYQFREFADAGGLISYGPSLVDAYRHAGDYVGRILAGARPADLPVQQASRFELVINLKTAKTLGLNVPPTLLARADEVIE